MNRPPSATIRGRVTFRPWRVGLLVNVDSETEVRHAISSLTAVWGGFSMPILDRKAEGDEILRAAQQYDVDSLYAPDASKELQALLRDSGYSWLGPLDRAPFHPGGDLYRESLLRPDSVQPDGTIRPWRGPVAHDLIVDAHLGHDSGTEPRTRPIAATRRRLQLSRSYVNPLPRGLCVVRSSSVSDVAWFWNSRALSGDSYPLADDAPTFNEAILAEVESDGIPVAAHPGKAQDSHHVLDVWGFDDLRPAQRRDLEAWAERLEIELKGRDRSHSHLRCWFSGFERVATSLYRVETSRTAQEIHVSTPSFPLAERSIGPGIVAAEINFHGTIGLDPRMTPSVPPYRQHSSLLNRALARHAHQVRVSKAGPVFGVQANQDEIGVPLVYNLVVMEKLFDACAEKVSQSNEGQFQMRAAEMFGGAMSDALSQPGIRAAINRVADSPVGITLDEIRQIIDGNRGEWPDAILRGETSPKEYVQRQTGALLNSGLLIPTLDVECAHCRVVSRVDPDDLATNVHCEFCGEESRLALSLSMAKPRWRYRLAAHVLPEKIRAFLPVMAAASVLGSMQHVEGPPPSHVFGLTISLRGKRPVEVDIATILHEDSWTVVLGEVKGYHDIDANDVSNLLSLQGNLIANGIPCAILFATLKDEFSEKEKEHIQRAVDRETRVTTRRGQSLPFMPLLLTNRDMSVHQMHEDHPWRWGEPGDGIFGIAVESCRRNLG